MGPKHGSDAGTGSVGIERIAAFSDGVIAIIITIMVLELKLSEDAAKGEVWSSFLMPLAPKLSIYALSFIIVGALWVNHHQLLAVVRRVTPQLMWMNLLLLADPASDRLPRGASPIGACRFILRRDHDSEFGSVRFAQVSSRPNARTRSRAHSVSPRYLGQRCQASEQRCEGTT